MFQFRRFPSYSYFIHCTIPYGGFPHSEISGSKLICSSPKLIAAYHVLHRLLMPRHSPCALFSLTSSKLKWQTPQIALRLCLCSIRSLATWLLLSNQNPLRWAFDLYLRCGGKGFTFASTIVTSRIIHFYLVSLVELCRLFQEVSLAKIVIITLLIKSFPLLLPSHNCINNYNVQFSRCIFVEIKSTICAFFASAKCSSVALFLLSD